LTQLRSVSWLSPSSRATWLIGLPVVRTSTTASRLNSGLYLDGRPTPHPFLWTSSSVGVVCPWFCGVGWLDSHATVGVFSNCIGVSMPSALWRRVRLWKISRYSKIALASSTRVFQRRRSSSSTCIRDQNASTMALS
jgi:hypothetical protein